MQLSTCLERADLKLPPIKLDGLDPALAAHFDRLREFESLGRHDLHLAQPLNVELLLEQIFHDYDDQYRLVEQIQRAAVVKIGIALAVQQQLRDAAQIRRAALKEAEVKLKWLPSVRDYFLASRQDSTIKFDVKESKP